IRCAAPARSRPRLWGKAQSNIGQKRAPSRRSFAAARKGAFAVGCEKLALRASTNPFRHGRCIDAPTGLAPVVRRKLQSKHQARRSHDWAPWPLTAFLIEEATWCLHREA